MHDLLHLRFIGRAAACMAAGIALSAAAQSRLPTIPPAQ